jgi:protein phosphatase
MMVSARTDVGEQKDTNEDAVVTASVDECTLLLVADGMGGHAAGDVASEIAASTVRDIVTEAVAEDRKEYDSILAAAIQEANTAVRDSADGESARSMGTTVVAALVDDLATIVNVGDSRAYTVSDTLEQITTDHSFVQTLIDEGEITPEEAQTHPRRNVVTQALGNETVDPDFFTISPEQYLLLCSDGLTEEVTEQRIAEIINRSESIDDATAHLIEDANANGGSDNISVVLADCEY